MTCEAWDVVTVPFPFTDKAAFKRRPALVLSVKIFNEHGHSLMAMITSSIASSWPGDCLVKNLASSGLSVVCAVRLKFFTLDNRLILRRIGQLAQEDQENVRNHIKSVLHL